MEGGFRNLIPEWQWADEIDKVFVLILHRPDIHVFHI